MKIVIVEDEPVIAQRLQRQIVEIMEPQAVQIKWFDNFDDAESHLSEHVFDLLFLDLNLHGSNGFNLLASVSAESFLTIIFSAYAEQAIKAFEYGVLDFVPKPFNKQRLAQAIERYHSHQKSGLTKQLAVKKPSGLQLIPVKQLEFVKADGHYTQLVELSGEQHLHDKAIDKLDILLPEHFARIHRSYIANLTRVENLVVASGGSYQLMMASGETLPVSRAKYKDIRQLIAHM